MISAPVFCRRFIGRSDELRTLADACRQAAQDGGSVVLVGGEAGIGKTRFLGEAYAMLGGAMRIVEAQCFEHVQSPLGPFAEILGELEAGAIESGGDRLAQFVTLTSALRRATASQPALVAIEDIHWADLATLAFLQYLTAKIGALKIALVLTFRSDELHRTHPLTPVLAKLERSRQARRIDLRPLTETEMRAFVASALEGHGDLEPETIRGVLDVAEGSPLFTEELLKHAVESSNGGRLELPLTIRAAVLDRITVLDDGDRDVLTHAAVFGRYFEPAFLAQLTGRTPEQVIATLRRARDLQLIVEDAENEDAFAFRHALVREALHIELLAAEVRPLHARIAAHLETLPPTDQRVQQLAYHYWSARVPDKAVTFNERAGDIALERHAYEDAARYYERALEFAAQGSLQEASTHEKMGSALRLAGRQDRAKRAFEQALTYYRSAGEWTKTLAMMQQISRIYWLLADAEAAFTWRHDALQMARERPEDPWYFACVAQMATYYGLGGKLAETEQYLAEAEQYRGKRHPAHEVTFFNARGFAEMIRGNFAGFLEAYRKSIAIAAAAGIVDQEVVSHTNVGYLATAFGQFATAREGFESAIELARRARLFEHGAYAWAGLAALEFLSGDYRGARRALERAVEDRADAVAVMDIQLASTAIPLGLRTEDVSFADRFAREDLIELAFKSGEGQRIAALIPAFAELYVERCQPDRARELLHRAIEFSGSNGKVWTCAQFCLYGAPDDLPRLRELVAEWASYPDNVCGKAFIALVDAFVARSHGDAVGSHAERALDGFLTMGFPYEQAVVLELLERRDEALAIYERIGDVRDAKRLRSALGSPNRRGRVRNELTEREREIAKLVATGKSNRAIAAALVISERTVENHLASIFGKLGVSSRTELATKVVTEPSLSS